MHSKTLALFLCIVALVGLGILYATGLSQPSPKALFTPQQPQLFSVGENSNTLLNVLATRLPQFVIDLKEAKFANLWQAYAKDRSDIVNAQVVNDAGTTLPVHSSFDSTNKQLTLTPDSSNQVKPGLYHLKVQLKTVHGKDITITQDFTWGVLAINTGKPVYQPGETVKIGMGVLDNIGNTKCIANDTIAFGTAKVWLTITSPSGKQQTLSTDDGSIIGSKECAPTSVTNNPDFQATYTPQEVGKYSIRMTAENINGKRSIDDYFTVSQTVPDFTIMRTSYPTRIYPYGSYPVEITVVANKDYSGSVSDVVPSNFTIADISANGAVSEGKDFKQITWQVNWQQGHTYTLTYTIHFPLVSPEFYLVGPLTVGSFTEGREWMIASDAVQLVQSSSNVVNSGTSVATTFGSAPTANDLEVVVCSETSNSAINSLSKNGGNNWSAPATLSVTSTPSIRMFYRRAKSGETNSYSCPFRSSTGVKAIQIFEYSGIATSGQLDATGTLSAANCNSSPFQASVSLTATNGNELVLSSHVSTTLRSVNSHTSGFTQEFAFNGSSGTFTSADQVVSLSGSYTDTVTFSGGAGTCSAVIASFITPVTLTQNGYRFFQNANSATPGSPIDLQNTDITLPVPHDPFRLRFLIDVDGNQTVAIGGLDFVLQYAQAPLGGDCSTLQDTDWNAVTSSTPIAYNVNSSSGGSGVSISSSGNDPTDTSPHSYTTRYENYYESFAGDGTDDITNGQNSLSNNQAGLWDVSLVDNTDDTQTTTFCFRVAEGDGAGGVAGDLDSYLHYPKVTTFYNEVNIKSGTVINSGTTIN